MANSRPFGHANFFFFFVAKPTDLRFSLGSTFCFFQDLGDARQIEMDLIQWQLNAKALDCGLGYRFGSFSFIHDLEAGTKTL